MYVISRNINGISINGKEFILDDLNKSIMKFPTPRHAIFFLLEKGAMESEIGYGYFVGTEKEPDMYTYGTRKYDKALMWYEVGAEISEEDGTKCVFSSDSLKECVKFANSRSVKEYKKVFIDRWLNGDGSNELDEYFEPMLIKGYKEKL
jgi:hypothetical protein